MKTNTTKGKKTKWIILAIVIIIVCLIGLGITRFLFANAFQETPNIPQVVMPDNSSNTQHKKNQDEYNKKSAEIKKTQKDIEKEIKKSEAEYKKVRDSMETKEEHTEKVEEIKEETKEVKESSDKVNDIMSDALSQLE